MPYIGFVGVNEKLLEEVVFAQIQYRCSTCSEIAEPAAVIEGTLSWVTIFER